MTNYPSFSASSSLEDRIVYVGRDVAVKVGEEADETVFVDGELRIIERPIGIYIEWYASSVGNNGNAADPASISSEWVVTPTPSSSPVDKSLGKEIRIDEDRLKEQIKRCAISLDIKDLRCYQCYEERRKRPPTHHHHQRQQISSSSTVVAPSNNGEKDNNSVELGDDDEDRNNLTASTSSLLSSSDGGQPSNSTATTTFIPWIRLMKTDGTNFSRLYFRKSLISEFHSVLLGYTQLKRSIKDNNLILVVDEKAEALQQSVNMLFNSTAATSSYLSKLVSDPYSTALTGLGKVTNYLQDYVVPSLMGDNEQNDQLAQMEGVLKQQKNDETDDAHNLRLHSEDEGYELVTQLKLPERPDITREDPITAEDWTACKTAEDFEQLTWRIMRGVGMGVSEDIRKDVWKYQLGYYRWEWTGEDRQRQITELTNEYCTMKKQWQSIGPKQAARFTAFSEAKALIAKDVNRTDRTHGYFQGDHNAHCEMLNDILMTYVMYNFDLGYVQGMSDLLAPLLVVMENEVDAFWSFVGFMDIVHENFAMDQASIRKQLMDLRDLTMIISPTLANYLESHNSDNMYFTFRWLLVWFKREFSFNNIMRLWEVLWTKHVNDLSMHIDVDSTLTTAEGMYHQLRQVQRSLPLHICTILGFKFDKKNDERVLFVDHDNDDNGTSDISKEKSNDSTKATD